MERLQERLEAAVLILECIWRIWECENSYALERAYDMLDEFLKRGNEVSLEEVREFARKLDEVLKECECPTQENVE
jgi:hypothetical protein